MSRTPITKGEAIAAANYLLLKTGGVGQIKGPRGFGRLELKRLFTQIYGEDIPLSAFQGHDAHVPKHGDLTKYLGRYPKEAIENQ